MLDFIGMQWDLEPETVEPGWSGTAASASDRADANRGYKRHPRRQILGACPQHSAASAKRVEVEQVADKKRWRKYGSGRHRSMA